MSNQTQKPLSIADRKRNIEADAATAATATARRNKLTLQLGKLGTKLTQMVGRSLVLLGP